MTSIQLTAVSYCLLLEPQFSNVIVQDTSGEVVSWMARVGLEPNTFALKGRNPNL